ncbi:unnamed protein product, partial [Bubo scandiacus]
MSTSLIKCKQEISLPSSVVSQHREDFPEKTVSSCLDRLFPKTSISGILWQLKTVFLTGGTINPWLDTENYCSESGQNDRDAWFFCKRHPVRVFSWDGSFELC